MKIKEKDLCIITDFDDTLTKGILDNGKRGSNSFSVFPNNPKLLGKEYVELTNKYFKYYYNLEQNPKLNHKEKSKLMKEWWEKEFELYKKYGLNKTTLQKVIEDKLIELKDKVHEFLELTNKFKIPVVIFSAGIYDLIHGFLRKIEADYDNVHVVANIFKFDKEEKFIGTKGEIIHSQNKTFEELSHLPIYSELKNKYSCLLLGDSLGDLKMIEGSKFKYVKKIGFLNKLPSENGYGERLKAHKDRYDIVIDGRENFTKVNNILKEILIEND